MIGGSLFKVLRTWVQRYVNSRTAEVLLPYYRTT